MDGDLQRETILRTLRDEPQGLDTNRLAERLGLHPNTVRWHLGLLTDAGLVSSRPVRRPGRGRPSVVFRLTPEGQSQGRDDYRLLATMLTETIATGADGSARSYETGVEWGLHLHDAEPGADVPELLDRQGFAAEAHGDAIEMRHCPFYALAESCPQVICELHRGIIDGALEASGSARRVARLDAFVEPKLCVAHLSAGEAARPTAA